MYKFKLFLFKLSIVISTSTVLLSCSEKKPAEAPIPEISVVEALQKEVPNYMEFVAEVFGEKDIPIRAREEGVLEGIHFDEGFEVKRGQLLYTIDPKPLEAKVNSQKSRVAEAETMLAKAKSDLDRYKPLAEINAVAQSDLDAKQAQFDAAVSSLDAAISNLESAEIQLGYTKIYSPINGIIGKTIAKVGEFVGREPNPVILNVVSKTDQVKVIFFLTESQYLVMYRELQKIRENLKVKSLRETDRADAMNMQLILSDGSVYKHKGRADFVDREVDPTTGTMLVQANFPNPDFILRPGLYAKIKIEVDIIEDAILVPQRCVTELQGKFSVYVVNDNIIESRQVVTGPKEGDYIVITEGLKPTDKIVIDALQKVQSGMEVKPSVIEFKSQTTQQ